MSEHDEFLLSQLLDGDLPQDEALALRRRLDSEPALRRVLDELRRVDGLVKVRRSDLPTINYAGFHAQLMTRIASASVGRASDAEVSEDDEFLLSRLIDRDLSGEEEAGIRKRLALEPALQARYASLNSLNAALLERRTALPAVDYSRFHKQLMVEIRGEAAQSRRSLRFPVWARFAGPLAAAAAIAMVVWLQPGQRPTDQPSNIEIAKVEQPAVQPAPDALAMAQPEPVTIVSTNAPVRSGSGTIVVQVGKPANGGSPTDSIQVSFARSTDIAESVQEGDLERSNQPSRKVFIAAANPPAPSELMTGDLF